MATWNFNSFDYLKPTELRSGYGTTTSDTTALTDGISSSLSTNPFGDYSSIGMDSIFSNSLSLCTFADTFVQQNAAAIAQAEAYNNQVFSQNLSEAQQTAALRDQLTAMGIDPNSVLGTSSTSTASTSNSQLTSLLGLLGLGGTTATNTASNSNNQLTQLLSLLGLGGTSATNTASTSSNQLTQLLSLLGLGGTSTNATSASSTDSAWYNSTNYMSEYYDIINGTKDDDSGSVYSSENSSDDDFWAYIDSKVAQSKQQSQLQSLLSLLGGTN